MKLTAVRALAVLAAAVAVTAQFEDYATRSAWFEPSTNAPSLTTDYYEEFGDYGLPAKYLWLEIYLTGSNNGYDMPELDEADWLALKSQMSDTDFERLENLFWIMELTTPYPAMSAEGFVDEFTTPMQEETVSTTGYRWWNPTRKAPKLLGTDDHDHWDEDPWITEPESTTESTTESPTERWEPESTAMPWWNDLGSMEETTKYWSYDEVSDEPLGNWFDDIDPDDEEEMLEEWEELIEESVSQPWEVTSRATMQYTDYRYMYDDYSDDYYKDGDYEVYKDYDYLGKDDEPVRELIPRPFLRPHDVMRGHPIWAIILFPVLGVLLLALMTTILCVCYRKRQARKPTSYNNMPYGPITEQKKVPLV